MFSKIYCAHADCCRHHWSRDTDQRLDTDFYGGEIFSLHANTYSLPRTTKRFVLRQDDLWAYAFNFIQPNLLQDEELQERMDSLIIFRDYTAPELFRCQSLPTQERLMGAVAIAYADVADVDQANQRKENFRNGYLFATQLTNAYVAKSKK